MNGHRGLGAGWLVVVIFLIVVVGLAVLGAAMRDERDTAERGPADRLEPTTDVWQPPGVNTDNGDGVPGTPHSSLGVTASAGRHRSVWTRGTAAYSLTGFPDYAALP
jgi:hypothetical protein